MSTINVQVKRTLLKKQNNQIKKNSVTNLPLYKCATSMKNRIKTTQVNSIHIILFKCVAHVQDVSV